MGSIEKFCDQRIVLRPKAGSFSDDAAYARWSNEDLDPVTASEKKWEWYHLAGFWISEGFNAAELEVPSSAVTLGLNPGLVIVACLIGNIIISIPLAGSAYLGSKYSINFPVIARASFGMWGSYIAIVIRLVVCALWYGIQGWLGGNAVEAMIQAIWPSFASWHLESLSASTGATAPALLSFAIFWLVSLPFLYLSIPMLRWIFLIKIILMPIFGIVLFTWALTAGHGWGPLFSTQSNITNGMSIGYAFMYTINAAISANATLAINMADITRYARSPRASWVTQLIALPTMVTLIELLGCVSASTSQALYGQLLWNPVDIILSWDLRVAKFFAGLLWAFATIGASIAANSISFGNDITGLFPKYFNIRRGQYLCAILGFAICPWMIEARATAFLSFLNGYSVFLGPLLGVLLSDMFLVRRGKGYNVYHLYKPNGIYWYTRGWNWRAFAAFAIGMVPQLPGLAVEIQPMLSGVARNYLNFASISWLDGFAFSSLAYYALYLAFPFPIQTDEEDKARQFIHGGEVVDEETLESSSGSEREKGDTTFTELTAASASS